MHTLFDGSLSDKGFTRVTSVITLTLWMIQVNDDDDDDDDYVDDARWLQV